MFALDLFNTDHERRIAEGAVDQLEQRRIDDLAMKMDDLVARAKDPAYKKNPAALAALMKEFQKCKAERDSYYKIRNETMGYGGLTAEAGIPGNVPTEKIPGKEDLLKGKGRSYYEGAEDYASIYSPEAIALGKRFCEHYNITDDTDVQLAVEIIDSYLDEFNATNTPVDLKKIRSGVADAFRQVYRGMGPGPNFRKRFQETQKKNSETGPLDQKLQRLKVQARRQFPLAHTDDEALILKLLDKETQDDQANRRTDARQDSELRKNFAFDQEQEDEIQDLQTSIKEHGGGIGPRQHWQDLMQERKLVVGDPVVVTAPNEFEGKTGEIYDFAPSGTFVIVDLYNHGKHSMHLSDVEYNQYADEQEEDDWYDEGVAEGWSDAMVARRTGTPRTPYSVYIKGKKWKDFENDDHAEAVANKLRAKFKAEGRDPSVITVAPTDIPEAIDKKDLVTKLTKDLNSDKFKNTPVDPNRKGWTGADKDDYGYTGYQGHGMPTDKQERELARKKKGVAEVKADPTGSWIVYGGNKVMKFKTHTGAKAYAEKNGGKVASSEYYADQIQKLGVGEAIVASGPSWPLDDRAVRKMVWDTMKINADTGEQAIQRALAVLAKKPQSRMVQDLQDKFQNLADRLAQGITEGAMSNLHVDLADVYNRLAPGIERNRDSFKAGQLYDALEAVAEQHGAEAEFKRMMNGARNRAHMDYDTNPGGFHNWFWYLPFAEEDVAEGLMKEPANRKEYLDQRDKLFRMMAVDSNPANKQIIKQALQDLEARYGNLKNTVKEESSTSSEAVERAILNRIMVAHTDLLMKFGPEKVMQAAEEVAYNVGDVDEIGTSDVSAYVHQVKQILGVPEEVNEKWSQKYKSSINCANPKGFSQKAHCAGRKK